ncbi:hypothetical protein NEPAR06_0387 [Nematocida parisii]|uniref:NOT2/NOT3/NOT5 C-terminal domain-containing protein n=1 Tax=Nematocida parisii (strain ERTm3) TaxID=935791 RepID=I3EG51_NEMP3|nr:uncharacterized protein NEPG_01307 [Nematocida parisii ERTm1]EIJ88198.1 hypothetical protein NEQG_01642 [Nematocida parisii ERTm3]KAI5125336.1 hypothetical protein NEPAR03_0011 [Nematocida parisii]EIJ93735.1 hypothetical protein NEPG_01307 [Nematocida parisii ERTm1]KAI5125460.1 hypothetical protein NEPAR08_0011 [Nematocida parisii]KAI5140658.1 hypothetical protein NEPAR04_0399 [Nematocida parisii]|eukprot:XP_013059135.1 hypothetical protein NEPG_01307 [Nematocida parisii ERTm1]
MFRDIYRDSLKIDGVDIQLSSDRSSQVFPYDREIDRILPESYKTAIRGTKEEKIDKFSEGTLFYVFFNHCGKRVQKDAYDRLIKLGWMYSKEMKTFLQIIKRTEETGLILYFDYCTWKKVTKEVTIDSAFLSTLEEKEN